MSLDPVALAAHAEAFHFVEFELWFHLQIMYLLDELVSIRDSFVSKESHCEQDQVEYLLSGIHTFL